MGQFNFAASSLKYLEDVHEDLKKIMLEAKERSLIDFDISSGHRSVGEQNILFNEGKSKLNGTTHKSKHNYYPSLAVDIYAYNGRCTDYSRDKMFYLSELIKECADDLMEAHEIDHHIVWGGDWSDFIDMPHYQLEKDV